jgi:hypothetical protein
MNLAEKLQRDGTLAGLKLRPARALIGWMPQRDAETLLAIPAIAPAPEQVRQVQAAHAAVSARSSGMDQTGAISETGDEAQDYLTDFRNKSQLSAGRSIQMADLTRLAAVQPVVHLDDSRHFDLPSTPDLVSLAKITLPMPTRIELPVEFDPQKRAWILDSANPDACVMGHFRTPVEIAPGVFGTGYGFCIAALPSVVQVVRFRGRYFLKDGYHRSLALLQKGIAKIPVIFEETDKLEIAGRFSDEIILGDRPPCLPDYLEDNVSAAVSHLAVHKAITIECSEQLRWGG